MAEINLTERCEMACEILQATNDGVDLDPQHLWLVQEWVNETLNEKGEQTFHELYQNVKQGYKPPWFHDIENLLRCQNGYVYWKGKQVEHYDSPWAYSSEGKKSAEELASARSSGTCDNISHTLLPFPFSPMFLILWGGPHVPRSTGSYRRGCGNNGRLCQSS